MEDRSVDVDEDFIPPEILEAADDAVRNSLPEKSKELYRKAFTQLTEWMSEKKTKSFDEVVLIAYFSELSKTLSPCSLWSKYSMIRTMLYMEKNISIKNYEKLKAFIKKVNVGAKSKKAKVFTAAQVKEYLENAPDETYLATKVCIKFNTNYVDLKASKR